MTISSGQTTGRAGKKSDPGKSVPGFPKRFSGRTSGQVKSVCPGFCLQRVSGLGLVLESQAPKTLLFNSQQDLASLSLSVLIANGAIIPTLWWCKNCLGNMDILLASYINLKITTWH